MAIKSQSIRAISIVVAEILLRETMSLFALGWMLDAGFEKHTLLGVWKDAV